MFLNVTLIYIVHLICCIFFKLVIEMERKNGELRKSIQELQLSKPKKIFPDVFLKPDK